MLMRQVYFSVYNLRKPLFPEETFALVVQNLKTVMVLLTCNKDGSLLRLLRP
jgi:hypothetical protein